jgi:acyl-CoA thioesterase
MSWISELLQLDRRGNTFVGPRPSGLEGRLFGGLIAAQALAAACATVTEGKLPQSLHLYFVRGGQPGIDVEFEVERTRDGRSFDTRRVTAIQQGSVILEMLSSFHSFEPGVDWHAPPAPMGDLAGATSTPVPPDLADRFEIRIPQEGGGLFTGPPYWIRTRHPVEPDPVIRACALTYMSDMGLMAAARPPGTPLVFGVGTAASLDHAIWLHRPFHPDQWHRYQATPLNHNDSRGLVVGQFSDASGTLIASMTQEALWRP